MKQRKTTITFTVLALLGGSFSLQPVQAQIVPQDEVARQQVQTSPPQRARSAPITLKQWSRLSKRERQLSIIAAVEGMLLAASSSQEAMQLSPQCLLQETPETLEIKISSMVDRLGNESFVDVFLAMTNCLNERRS